MISPRWDLQPCDDPASERLAAVLGIAPIVARLLCQRGLGDPETAQRFLNPSLDHLHDPLLLADMRVAVDRIMAAIERKERIAIHGDYDVDGITSTVILRRALEMLGADVVHFIPERLKDGYGLQPVAIERLHADGVALVVSVDCGIRGAEAARRARELGVDLIITDHHEPDAELPPALAVINPKRRDCSYPDKYLAGVGVALKLVQALCRRADRDGWMPGFIKVAAIGTLADVVPLVGENRVIAKLGLDLLTRGPHKIGLRSLLDISGLTGKTIDSYHISFLLAPRVNAAGRMSTPDIATRLLLAADEAMAEEVRQLAMTLDGENLKRQEEEADILAAAKKIVQTDPDIGARSVLVVAGDGWHRGVIGIVASKLVDAFHRPAIVLSVEDGVAHGSCRSISKFDMLGALERCAHLFMRFGGHRQAAGLALEASRIKELRLAVNAVADETLGPDDLMPRLRIDGDLTFRGITGDVAYGVAALAPFGAGNPRPVFAARRVEIIDGPRKLKERHLKMALKQDGRIFRAIAWRAAERHDYLTEHKAALDVAFSLEQNQYNGETFVELTLADLRQSEV
ncbi:MAG: single-stranded-DNA-specific exonuclease RecJ [Acidobacteria bacterium 13_1_40CM_4_65_8]|jgi:single-stranded-DNA-specific exonuclease|nr:MAG: single-stranded-DNA-specific exonuclease RecJ [Acidobacteria bacterium 13_1_40CM_4_65_8]OLE82179.1 MAG: single-stranded-DNA-specific exonuclease RecJ [Acidobacteria bacterium 13_1_20CM_2_65_9]